MFAEFGSGGLLNNVGVPANIAKPNSGQTELSADVALQDHQRARSPKNPLALVPPQGGRVVKDPLALVRPQGGRVVKVT